MDGPAPLLARRLGMVVADDPHPGPVRAAAAAAHARTGVPGRVLYGYGAAPTPSRARLVAVLECAERWAQFGRSAEPAVRDSFVALGAEALCPLDFGLYTPAQYRRPGFGPGPFDERAPLEWVRVTELGTGSERLVPVEFVHPRAPLARPALVAETSSGSAIHTDPTRATVAALCEVIERDAAMLLWYRRPRSPVVPVGALPESAAQAVADVARAGFVGLVARIDHDIAVPTFLVVALRGRSFRYGLGTHPDPAVALAHAVAELGCGLRSTGRPDRYAHLPLDQVHGPAEHRALYDDGPLHNAFRTFLDDTLVRPAGPVPSPPPAPADPLGPPDAPSPANAPSPTVAPSPTDAPCRANAPSPADALGAALDALARHRLAAYAYDLTPPELADCGVSVVRVLVPGLIPLSFGHHRLRLGCRRLVGDGAPGRLSTLLPHFLG